LKDKNPRPLAPNDRIVFGFNSCYVFKHDKSSVKPSTDAIVTAEFASNEKMDLADKSGAAQRAAEKVASEKEYNQKLAALNAQMEAERKA